MIIASGASAPSTTKCVCPTLATHESLAAREVARPKSGPILWDCGTKCSGTAVITKPYEHREYDSRFRTERGDPAFTAGSDQYCQFAVGRSIAGRGQPSEFSRRLYAFARQSDRSRRWRNHHDYNRGFARDHFIVRSDSTFYQR